MWLLVRVHKASCNCLGKALLDCDVLFGAKLQGALRWSYHGAHKKEVPPSLVYVWGFLAHSWLLFFTDKWYLNEQCKCVFISHCPLYHRWLDYGKHHSRHLAISSPAHWNKYCWGIACYICVVHSGVILGFRVMLTGMINVGTITSK